jgi:hypothetical protein
MQWASVRLAVATAIIVIAFGDNASRGQSIGVYFDPDATTCSTQIPANGAGYFYIIAELTGPAAGGITGAACRLELQTQNLWIIQCAFPEYYPGCDEFVTSDGGQTVWLGCQTGSSGFLVLGRYLFLTVGTTPTTYLRILEHRKSGIPDLACPRLRLCDGPVFSSICVPGGQAIVNGPACTVATQPGSWSQVKSLYD